MAFTEYNTGDSIFSKTLEILMLAVNVAKRKRDAGLNGNC
jgi:hypothetical protein